MYSYDALISLHRKQNVAYCSFKCYYIVWLLVYDSALMICTVGHCLWSYIRYLRFLNLWLHIYGMWCVCTGGPAKWMPKSKWRPRYLNDKSITITVLPSAFLAYSLAGPSGIYSGTSLFVDTSARRTPHWVRQNCNTLQHLLIWISVYFSFLTTVFALICNSQKCKVLGVISCHFYDFLVQTWPNLHILGGFYAN
jgi:hypothetical protein